MRIAVFTNNVDKSVSVLWNRINIAIIMHCLPSEVDNESHKDIQTLKVILAAREEYKERESNKGDQKW